MIEFKSLLVHKWGRKSKFNDIHDCFRFADYLAEKAETQEDKLKLKEFSKMHSTILTEYLGEFKILLHSLLNEGKFRNERKEIHRFLREIDHCLRLK